jgi:hypothetical protein
LQSLSRRFFCPHIYDKRHIASAHYRDGNAPLAARAKRFASAVLARAEQTRDVLIAHVAGNPLDN